MEIVTADTRATPESRVPTAETERDELQEKLSYAMMEVNARAERLEHSQAQVAASRGEILSLENIVRLLFALLVQRAQNSAAASLGSEKAP